jgi:hypothetical protein
VRCGTKRTRRKPPLTEIAAFAATVARVARTDVVVLCGDDERVSFAIVVASAADDCCLLREVLFLPLLFRRCFFRRGSRAFAVEDASPAAAASTALPTAAASLSDCALPLSVAMVAIGKSIDADDDERLLFHADTSSVLACAAVSACKPCIDLTDRATTVFLSAVAFVATEPSLCAAIVNIVAVIWKWEEGVSARIIVDKRVV